ncbi:MAG: PepSY-like domain-containing protein [Muribaculaceae bacterium]|nr:PepSY-like domain-containing protein [Muribaculaceae bacterium]
MRKLMLTLLAVIFCVAVSEASIFDKYTFKRENLPEEAQAMLDEHFPKGKVALIKVDKHLLKKTDYDVQLTNGTKIEFSNKGKWTSVNCGKREVPEALVPSAVRRYVSKNFAGKSVTGITKRNIGYDVILSDGTQHRFNMLGQYKGLTSGASDDDDTDATADD